MEFRRLSAIAIVAIALTSCDNGSDNNYHSISIIRPTGIAYADQQTDTLAVQSTDSWTASVENDGDAHEWFTPREFSKSVAKNTLSFNTFNLNLEANTTDSLRKAYFVVKSNGKTARKTYAQVPWLNITNPSLVVRLKDGTVSSLYDTDHLYELRAYFYFNFPAAGGNNNLNLTLYAQSAVISTTDDWIDLQEGSQYTKTINAGREEKQPYMELSIPVTVAANPATEKREGTITIKTSNGVSQTISVIQDKKSED